jgi:outer membrane protein TolC
MVQSRFFSIFSSGLLALGLWLTGLSSFAQTSLSLQQAIDYGIKNQVSVKNAQLDIENASARINETKSIGFPQISGAIQLQHSPRIQQFVTDGRANSPFSNQGPTASERNLNDRLRALEGSNPGDLPAAQALPPDYVGTFAFGLKNNGIVSLTASQLIFSGSYLVGLQAAKVYRQVTQKSLINSKVTVVENISKAYYGALVNKERLDLLKYNVGRLETLLNETKQFNQNGLVEKIDVDRLEVQFNNLKIEYENVERLTQLSEDLLKFQMGMPLTEKIVLTDKLANMSEATFTPVSIENLDYNKRIEYSLLEDQKMLDLLNLQNAKVQRYPTLGASATYGYNPAASRLQDITQSKRWVNYINIGVSLNIPITDWFYKNYTMQQLRYSLNKTENNIGQFKQTVNLQVQQSNTTLKNALESLKTQKRNLELAQEVVRVTKIKYQQGVGSNIEVVNAEADLRSAQTNYYAALYDTLIAKVDLDKAIGTLYTGQ